jgi:hypothetical protein
MDFEDEEDVEEGQLSPHPDRPQPVHHPDAMETAVPGIAAVTTATSVAGSVSGSAVPLLDQRRGSATEVDEVRSDDARPWKFIGSQLAEEEKVEESVAGGDRKYMAADEMLPLMSQEEVLYLRELIDALDRM